MHRPKKTLLVWFVAAVSMLGTADVYAQNKQYGYECVTQYGTCGSSNINQSCNNALGLKNKLATVSGSVLDHGLSESSVWDADSIDKYISVDGLDESYTDTATSGLFFWSMHGHCGGTDIQGGYCTSDADCATNYRCATYNSANRCIRYQQGRIITCSNGDKFGHVANMVTQVRLGESTVSGTWGGMGSIGGINQAIFDTSCPFSVHWMVEVSINMFVGLHLAAGYAGYNAAWPSTYEGDVLDSATRGSNFATRIVNGQPVGPAHYDTSRLDEPSKLGVPSCSTAISCARNQSWATFHLSNETWPSSDSDDETSSPTWCQNLIWCHF